MKNLINGTRLLKSMHTDLCAGIRCKNCTMCTDDGGCAVEEWIDKFPSAEQTEPYEDEFDVCDSRNGCYKCEHHICKLEQTEPQTDCAWK